MKKTPAMLTALLLALAVPAAGVLAAEPVEELWNRTFGGQAWDEGLCVRQTADGGFVMTGLTQSEGAGGSDVWLIKTDSGGSEQWSKTFGGSRHDKGHCVRQTSDGGYMVAGWTQSYGQGAADIWLIKTDSGGDEVWNKTFGGSGNDEGHSTGQTSDGGYMVAGWTQSYGQGGADAWLIKTDAGGDEVWNKTFGGPEDDYVQSAQQTSDGGYILAGWTYSAGNGGADVWLIKTDPSGDQVWSKTFGGAEDDYGLSVQQTSDHGYIVAGWTYSSGAGQADVWLIKTDPGGDEAWSKTFGGPDADFGHSVQQTSDGGYIIAGNSHSYGTDGSDVWLVKTDASGNEQWNRTFGGREADFSHSAQQTADGGYIVAGETYSFGAGKIDAWLIGAGKPTGTPAVYQWVAFGVVAAVLGLGTVLLMRKRVPTRGGDRAD